MPAVLAKPQKPTTPAQQIIELKGARLFQEVADKANADGRFANGSYSLRITDSDKFFTRDDARNFLDSLVKAAKNHSVDASKIARVTIPACIVKQARKIAIHLVNEKFPNAVCENEVERAPARRHDLSKARFPVNDELDRPNLG